jgi:acetyl-CoA decarbonylase/synthase complex subunit gamma
VKDTLDESEVTSLVSEADAFIVDYVGIALHLDGFAVEAASGDAGTFAKVVAAVRSATDKAIILIASDPEIAKAGVEPAGGRTLLYGATEENLDAFINVAKESDSALAIQADTLEQMAELTEKAKEQGVEDLVLDPRADGYLGSLKTFTVLRRLALKENFRPLGFPLISFPGAQENIDEILMAGQHIAKYGGFIVLENFDPARMYALLVLRQNIYTDPQKPIQVQPGIYEINNPDGDAPLMVTTNFSITYFSIANEIEGSGWPGWLLVADAEGMSVLTAWAAGKFDAERIAKDVKAFDVESKVNHKKLILPGHVSVLSGELEEELPGWEILVGPRESVDIGTYLKTMWEK